MKKEPARKKQITFSSVLSAIGRALLAALSAIGRAARSAWSVIKATAADLKDRFWKLDKEKQRYVAAGIVGGTALILLILALVIGLSSAAKARRQEELSVENRAVTAAQPAAVSSTQEPAPAESPASVPASAETLPELNQEPDQDDDVPDDPAQLSSVSLKKHDQSPEVLSLQKRLISLGYLEIDEPTDYYGSSTEYAVKLFQRQHDLEQDGIAGETTLSLLYSDDAQKYALKAGAEGRDVKMLQEQLYELGYLSRSDIDSVYGEVTLSAVAAFQKRNGLTADGIAGEKTLEKLYSDEAKSSKEKEEKEKATAKPTNTPKATSKSSKSTPKTTAKSTPKVTATPKQSSKEKKINKFINAAKSKVGCEYVLGGHGPNTFDCSGFVYWCLKQAGVSTTRLSAAGYSKKKDWKEITSYSDVEKGDILFFCSDNSSSVSHTGIYIGSGMMIDASSSNGKVVKRAVSSYWKSVFVNARRPW